SFRSQRKHQDEHDEQHQVLELDRKDQSRDCLNYTDGKSADYSSCDAAQSAEYGDGEHQHDELAANTWIDSHVWKNHGAAKSGQADSKRERYLVCQIGVYSH